MPNSLDFETVDTAREIVIHNYLHLLAITFLFYDHFITSGNEVEYLWRRQKTQSAYWFFFNRYFAFFGNIAVTVLGFTTLHPERFEPDTLISPPFTRPLFSQLQTVQSISAIAARVQPSSSLYCSFRVLAYMVSSGAVLIGISSWALFGQKSAPSQQGSGCHIGLSSITWVLWLFYAWLSYMLITGVLYRAIRLAGAWEALFVYDSILFGLTMAKTWKGRHEFAIIRASVPIISLIFRDGAIYFAVMALANLANILTFYFCGPFLRGGLSTFASAISVTMMSRLMLNLHETADAGLYSTNRSTISTNIECHSPTSHGIELDTLWSGDLNHTPTAHGQSFRLDESTPLASILRSSR